MKKRKILPNLIFSVLSIIACSILNVASGHAATDLTIHAAGATFPYPLYSKWFSDYNAKTPSVKINYQSIGSGAGIKQFLEGTIDFGASDAPMTDEELAKVKSGSAIHIPTCMGAVVLAYNIPGLSGDLKLSPSVLAGIFLGKIKKWNDPLIKADNPKTNLPETAILVAHRSDGSGTTSIFTDYLAKVSPEWKSKVGAGKAVSWPTGLGGKGNEGVTGIIKQTAGSIGYVELIYADQNKLAKAMIKNKAGQFVAPTLEAVTAAAKGSLKSMPEDFRVSITDAEGKASYPISGFTYLLLSNSIPGPKGKAIVEFLNWALTEGQKSAPTLGYSALPPELTKKVQNKVKSIKVN